MTEWQHKKMSICKDDKHKQTDFYVAYRRASIRGTSSDNPKRPSSELLAVAATQPYSGHLGGKQW